MNKLLAYIASLILLTGMSLAQNSAPQATPSATPSAAGSAPQPNRVAAGTVIPAELAKSIDAKKSKPGDPVVAKTSQDLLSNGQVVIPRGTKITGHVTAAKPHEKSDPASSVGIAFDQIAIKNGPELPFQADIQAMGRPVQSAAAEAAIGPMDSGVASSGNSNQSMGGRPGMSQPSAPSYPSGAAGPAAPSQEASGVALSATSKGVVGMEGVSLNAQPSQGTEGNTISSANKNVHLDSGTQLILRAK